MNTKETVPVKRWWLKHVVAGLYQFQPLQSGPLGDFVFGLREQLKDIADTPSEQAAPDTLPPEAYLVWSNEHTAWWRPNSAGYTRDVAMAGRYTREEAIEIARGARGGWRPGTVSPEIAVAERDVLEMMVKR